MGKLREYLEKIFKMLKSFYARKVLFYTVSGAVIVAIAVLIGVKIYLKRLEEKITAQAHEAVQKTVKNIFINIPPGAFPSSKSFRITPLGDAEIEAIRRNVGPFIGDVYNVQPEDGKQEFAYIPIKIKFYFPADFYYGYDFNNLSLAYIPDDNPSVYKLFNGSSIGKDDRGYFVEAEVFHTSRIGIVAKNPEEQVLDLKMLNEAPESPKSAVLVVPGEDANFSGYIGGTNIWSSLFPDRYVFLYEYPLVDSRSMAYRDMVNEFFTRTGKESYIEFEATRLASELRLRSNMEFNIIAHGIGGLIARLAVESNPDIKNVKKIILISTPNHGTNVSNPVYFSSLMYGKSFKALSEIFKLPEDEMKAVYLHVYSYIETVNTYWKDILPNSEVLQRLSELGPRKDVKYLSIVGKTPPLDIDVRGTSLERFYPELVEGGGDGVVSVESAFLDGASNLAFEGSFYEYYTKSEVMETVKDFIEKEKLPKVPEFKSDTYAEYVPESEKVVTEATTTETVTEKATETAEKESERKNEEFKSPKGFVFANILNDLGSIDLPSYDSAGCLMGDPYVATPKGLYIWKRLVKSGSFSHLRKIDDTLTMMCDGWTCSVNAIGFRKLARLKGFDPSIADDIIVLPDGEVMYTERREAGVVDLMIFSDEGDKRLDFSPGFYGKLIPLPDGRIVFLTDSMLTFVDRTGKVLKKISASSLTREGYSLVMKYAYEKDGLVFILTKDYYLVVYDEKTGKSWTMGEGWVGNRKIVDVGKGLVIIGNRSLNFVDVAGRELLRFIQITDEEIVDGFSCDGKLYIVLKKGGEYTIRVMGLGTGIM